MEEGIVWKSDSIGFYGVIEAIEHRPSLFGLDRSIEDLYTFLQGLRLGMNISGNTDAGNPSFDGFSNWVSTQINSTHGQAADWKLHILNHCNTDSGQAFDLFFDLVKRYRKETINSHKEDK